MNRQVRETGYWAPSFSKKAPTEDRARQRARKLFEIGQCEACGVKATDRHHKDGNPHNNTIENIAALCRRCHMKADGRLQRFIGGYKAPILPPSPCTNCQKLAKPLRRGLCHACNEYTRRNNGEARPIEGAMPSKEKCDPCAICGFNNWPQDPRTGSRWPINLSGVGVNGKGCRRCYSRLFMARKAEKMRNG